MHYYLPVSGYTLKTRSFRSSGYIYGGSRRPLHEQSSMEPPPLACRAVYFMLLLDFGTFA